VHYDWNFARLTPYVQAFGIGIETTLALTGIVIVAGTILGFLMGLLLASSRTARVFLYPIIDLVRALPPLVLILFMYYLLTVQVIGTTVAAFWVAAIALSLNLAAFTADLVRAAIQNVPYGALEAATALGMSKRQRVVHISLPHVLRELIPGMTVLYIGMLKATSLASVINVREVVYAAETVIADISRSLEAWTVVACVYAVLVIPATYGARALERWSRQERGGRQHG
jgi:polar amino acid transport system permease protein